MTLTIISVVVSGCGGGETTFNGEPVYTAEGKITASSGQGVGGVSVIATLNTDTFGTTTDASGYYKIQLPQNYVYPASFVAVISKPGYIPSLLNFGTNGVKPTTTSATSLSLDAAKETDVIFTKGLIVTHLGDASFGGAANSQLQVPASGKVWLDSFIYTNSLKQKYRTLCIQMVARGVQSTSNNDIVSLSVGGQAGTYIIQTMSDSDPNGGYSTLSNCFDITSFPASTSIQVQINSGNGRGSDYDDFEFVNVRGILQ